jgi:hypothetical protein
MTRGEGFLSGRAASRMDRVGSDYSAKTAGPCCFFRGLAWETDEPKLVRSI